VQAGRRGGGVPAAEARIRPPDSNHTQLTCLRASSTLAATSGSAYDSACMTPLLKRSFFSWPLMRAHQHACQQVLVAHTRLALRNTGCSSMACPAPSDT
jgi:hypothetical protein